MRFLIKPLLSIALIGLSLSPIVHAAENSTAFELNDGERVAFLGDALIEGEQYSGWIELMLTTRFPDRNVTFRNLGWNGDTPAGDSRFGLSLLQAGREPADEGWKQLQRQLEEAKPTVVFVGYGMASSFDGDTGLPRFRTDYRRLLDSLETTSPGARLVLLGPVRHEALGEPWPNPAKHNDQLARYDLAIQEIARDRKARYISLLDMPGVATAPAYGDRRTVNGIHLTDRGYRTAAEAMEDALWGKGQGGAWRTSAQSEALRQAILRKNEWFFHRSRPANMAYIFGFRKAEQGRNAAEVLRFDDSIAAEEKRIALLRPLRPASVPELPLRAGNLVTKLTEQPHPEFEMAEGLEATLWAENPRMHKPIQMNFDPKGRLWVVSSEVYPQIEPGQAATDQIMVLEDTSGAGRADKATVFATGLLIPTGIEPVDGGCYVAQSTELLHFKDTDGDGKADLRRAVLRGFGTEDTHHNLHTLHWGPDGRLYMAQSVYTRTNTETPHGVVRLKAGGIFRFDPRDERMEILYRGWVNAWGHQFDDYGQSFITDGAGSLGISWGVPGATYFTLAPARRVLESASPGRYPKFCGLEIVRSTHFPTDWQGDMITCDFRAHRIVRFKISDHGAGYLTQEMPDLMRTVADSFRPIDVKLGPDGALYVADWSNPIIQHGEVDFRDTRRDKVHGRIWRIAFKGRALLPNVDLTALGNLALLDKLITANGFERERSRRVLVERGAEPVLADLSKWTKRQTTDRARLEAFWMYQAFNRVSSDLSDALLASKEPRIRAAAVRGLLSGTGAALTKLTKLVADENPRVRLEAVRGLGMQTSFRSAEAALAVLDRPMDPFLDYALWLTINELAEPWAAAVKSGAWPLDGRERQLEFALKSIEPALASDVLSGILTQRTLPRDGSGPWIELIGTAGGARELRRLFDAVLKGGFVEPAMARALAALSEAARLRGVKPEGDLESLSSLLKAKNEKLRSGAIALVGRWKLSGFSKQLIEVAGSTQAAPVERSAAFEALRELGGPAVEADLMRLIHESPSPEVRREAVVTLASVNLPTALPEVIAVLKTTADEASAQSLWRDLLAIRGASAALAVEFSQTPLPAAIARAGLRPAREGNQSPMLVQALMNNAGLALSQAQLTLSELQQLAQAALARGDPARGERIYRRPELACVACHAIGGAGGKIGPDMTSIGASAPPDYLVESLLYPNSKIKEGYHSVLISTTDQQEHSGMVVRENASEVILRNAANQEVSVPVKSIAKRTAIGSLMPAGLIDALLPEERLDLIKFLSQLGKPGPYDAAKGGVARLWRVYRSVSANSHLGVERVVNGDFTLNDWSLVYSTVNGILPSDAWEADLAQIKSGTIRALYAATQFSAAGNAPVVFQSTGGAKDIWVNGKVARADSTGRFAVAAKSGVNTLVVQIDTHRSPDGFKLNSPTATFLTD